MVEMEPNAFPMLSKFYNWTIFPAQDILVDAQ